MKIWVDADACPGPAKDIVFRAAMRTGTYTTLVANHSMRLPRSPYLSFLHVGGGFDVADNVIVQRMSAGDLVITQDIPLAASVIESGGLAMGPRGEKHDKDSIGARLSTRNFMESLRETGVNTGGPRAFSQADRQQFANTLDRILLEAERRDSIAANKESPAG